MGSRPTKTVTTVLVPTTQRGEVPRVSVDVTHLPWATPIRRVSDETTYASGPLVGERISDTDPGLPNDLTSPSTPPEECSGTDG